MLLGTTQNDEFLHASFRHDMAMAVTRPPATLSILPQICWIWVQNIQIFRTGDITWQRGQGRKG